MNFALNFFRPDKAGLGVTNREIAVLSVIETHKETGICAADISEALAQFAGKEPRLSTIYNVLISLQDKGLITVSGTSVPDHGGRTRKLFGPSKTGLLALELGRSLAVA